jgi:hypothetical protein
LKLFALRGHCDCGLGFRRASDFPNLRSSFSGFGNDDAKLRVSIAQFSMAQLIHIKGRKFQDSTYLLKDLVGLLHDCLGRTAITTSPEVL